MAAPPKKTARKSPKSSVPFLLSQMGAHVSATFGDRIAPLGLKPYHAGVLSVLGSKAGITQQALAGLLGVFPSRLVGLLDDLARLNFIERRASPGNRRSYALHLTKAGHETWARVGEVAAEMQDDLCAALNDKEREVLADLLTRIVAQQQITPGIHPAYRRMGGMCGE